MTKYSARSVIIGRKPRAHPDEQFKSASFKVFTKEPNPLQGMTFPDQELDFANIEYIVFSPLFPLYYLEGNDLIAQDIQAMQIEQKGTVLHVTLIK